VGLRPQRRPPLPPGGTSVLLVVYCFIVVRFGHGSSVGMVFVYERIRSTNEGKSESTGDRDLPVICRIVEQKLSFEVHSVRLQFNYVA